MPKGKPTAEELKERKKRAKDWKSFRRDYKITQRKLADLLQGVGCRRTIQMVESAKITPHQSTLLRFEVVKNRYISEQSN
jgi:predicted transcriptional regulator